MIYSVQYNIYIGYYLLTADNEASKVGLTNFLTTISSISLNSNSVIKLT